MANFTQQRVVTADGHELILARDVNFVPVQGVTPIDLHRVGSQEYPVGSELRVGERTFRYVEFGGTTKAADLMQAEIPDAAHDDLDPTGSGTGAGVAIGDTIISIATAITLVVNEYAGGFLCVEVDTGIGYMYQIKSNEVAAAAANANVVLWEPLKIALDSTSDVKLVKSRYKEAIIQPTTTTAAVCGVSMGVGADGSFGWVTTRGPAAVRIDGTPAAGLPVMPSVGTAGEVEEFVQTEAAPPTALAPIVGIIIDTVPTDSQVGIVNLMGIE